MKEMDLWENAPYINKDAIFIADSHFIASESATSQNKPLLDLLKALIQTPPSQVFLMGDIAHILIGAIQSSTQANAPLIDILSELDQHTYIWWFEGNHDFCLSSLQSRMPNTHFIPRAKQPIAFCYAHHSSYKKALLAHGDIFLDSGYECYIHTLTSPLMIFCLRILDRVTFGGLYKLVGQIINRKPIRKGNAEFEAFTHKRTKAYQHYLAQRKTDEIPDLIIEGHFHLGRFSSSDKTLYISLPSFNITRSIFDIESAFKF